MSQFCYFARLDSGHTRTQSHSGKQAATVAQNQKNIVTFHNHSRPLVSKIKPKTIYEKSVNQ